MGGCVAEKADAMDAEVGEDLAAEPDFAEDTLAAILMPLTGARLAVEDDAGGRDRPIDFEAAACIVQINEGAAAGLGDDA